MKKHEKLVCASVLILILGLAMNQALKSLSFYKVENVSIVGANTVSVSEIAKINNTSRQAVNDIIQRTSKVLLDYEEKLKLLSKFNLIKADVKEILEILKSKDFNKKEVETRLSKILEVI